MTKLTNAMVRFQSTQKREKRRRVTCLRERCGDGLALVSPKVHVGGVHARLLHIYLCPLQ
jgi:hypothetical protein